MSGYNHFLFPPQNNPEQQGSDRQGLTLRHRGNTTARVSPEKFPTAKPPSLETGGSSLSEGSGLLWDDLRVHPGSHKIVDTALLASLPS